jgi:molecular chaperone GrpE
MSNPEQNAPQEEMSTNDAAAGTLEMDAPESEPMLATPPEAQGDHPPAGTDNGSSTETRIAALEKERDEYKDQWLRSAAEFQNFRKREERLRIERERNASVRLIQKLLPVLDDLLRGAQHVPEELTSNDWVNGMLAIERKLWNILEQEGVTAVESAPGTPFDPTVHEALLSEESDEYESGHIIGELERGYRRHDTILRPARVRVAR